MNKIKLSFTALLIAFGIGAAVVPSLVSSTSVGASAASDAVLGGASSADPDGGGGAKLEATFVGITNILLYIIGAVAVIMIIIGGIMYTVSSGDPGKAKKAKDTILYSVVGLVVAILAYSIVNFVVVRLIAPAPAPAATTANP